MTNPTEFLSRTGYRQVKATTNANLSGVITSVGNVTSVGTLTTSLIPEGSNLYFTDERAEDAVGGILTDTATIDFTYNDGANTIIADLKALTGDVTTVAGLPATTIKTNVALAGSPTTTTQAPNDNSTKIATTAYADAAAGAATGTYTDEKAQDAVGSILTDTATIDFTYNDPANTITADLKNTTVVAGSYTLTDLTVDSQGRITSAANGTAPAGYTDAQAILAAGTDYTNPFLLMGA